MSPLECKLIINKWVTFVFFCVILVFINRIRDEYTDDKLSTLEELEETEEALCKK